MIRPHEAIDVRETENWRVTQDWHPWFAWRPVWAQTFGWTWLRRIERRWVVWESALGIHWGWEYR